MKSLLSVFQPIWQLSFNNPILQAMPPSLLWVRMEAAARNRTQGEMGNDGAAFLLAVLASSEAARRRLGAVLIELTERGLHLLAALVATWLPASGLPPLNGELVNHAEDADPSEAGAGHVAGPASGTEGTNVELGHASVTGATSSASRRGRGRGRGGVIRGRGGHLSKNHVQGANERARLSAWTGP